MPPPIDFQAGEPLFNPSEYTEKELLKLLYRDFQIFNKKFDDFSEFHVELDRRIQSIEIKNKLEELKKEDSAKAIDKKMKIGFGLGALILTGIEMVFKFLIK